MTKREQKRDPRFDNLCLWLSGLILSGRGEKEREKEKRTVLLVTRKNGKVPRDAWQNRSSLYVVRVVKPQVRSRDCFDVDFTANSDEGLYLRTEYKPRVPVFRALSINRYHEPRRGVVWLVCPCSSVFLQRSRVNSFADTFIFRISGPYLSIKILRAAAANWFPSSAPSRRSFSFSRRSRGKHRKGWQCLRAQGHEGVATLSQLSVWIGERWQTKLPIDPLFALFRVKRVLRFTWPRKVEWNDISIEARC